MKRALGTAVAAAVAAGLGVAGCSTGVEVHSSLNPAAHFGEYRTFSMAALEGPPEGFASSARTVEIERRVVPLVEAAMLQRGYRELPSGGDVLVAVGAGRRGHVVQESSDIGASWLPEDEHRDFVDGTVVVDAFEARTKVLVWHSASFAVRGPGEIDQAQLSESVRGMLASFPPAAARSPLTAWR